MVDEPALPNPTHEPTDISPWLIWIGVPALIACVVGFALLILWMFPGRTVDRTIHLPLPQYPSPRLQVSPREDLVKFRAARINWLNSSGWIDRAHGVTHIPIREAMREVATEGIEDWPAAPSPQSTVPTPTVPRSRSRP